MEPASAMTSRKGVLAVVLIFLSLPAVLAIAAAATFYAHNRSNGTLVSSGQSREYLLYVPKRYDRTRPTPLVISMHGAGGWPMQQMELSRWNRVADREGFLVVYPSGVAGAGPRVWHMGEKKDVQFISDLIDKLQASFNIDPSRIYANGISNGGGMAFVLSCTMSDRIAAVGMVGAANLLRWKWCTDRTPVPMIAFHGTADSMAPYRGGTSWVAAESFPDVGTWTANWARRNRCAPDAVDTIVASDVTRREYAGCADDASVVLYTIRGGGHTWPGGQPLPEWFAGPTSRSIDASQEMWAFFRQHPLRRK
jgi:polyhydroxybutyrate depolymerase